MRLFITSILTMTGSAAAAHPGHWAEAAGHDHWAAGIAIGLAGLAALWGAAKGKKEKEAIDETEEGPEGEPA
ncbi:hypothetical protein SAMN04488005_0195 [Yoonia tamlensis]|uniref:LPXTG-motif cell wall anchor domain-containing protein n=1 Tax=Yoonia tamlensis TaxID=390270 RepID=A0A1I6FPP8_9RHOB|nr:DUF6732 family protein [Yoonia tamlensis]SFR31854.1 hypothetical protein SAMN04488005_0195 [Yoonia tamlensis]